MSNCLSWFQGYFSDSGVGTLENAFETLHLRALTSLTTHRHFIERVDWPAPHGMFKARDAKTWQHEFSGRISG